MDRNEQQLQSLGICHRLFCFIMKTLAAQALKPVTLGSPRPLEPSRKISAPAISPRETGSLDANSKNGNEDSESLASIDIEDETSRLLGTEGERWSNDQGKAIVESVCESISKAPRKMVSIKDEPEVINESKKRKKNGAMERRYQGEIRPLRSILKVGSNLSKQSTQVEIVNVNLI